MQLAYELNIRISELRSESVVMRSREPGADGVRDGPAGDHDGASVAVSRRRG